MFTKKQATKYKSALSSVDYRKLVHGEKTLMAEFKLAKGAIVPTHSHEHEQTGYLISGKMQFNIAGEIYEAEAGDAWNIAGHTKHSVKVWQDCRVIEVFSPVREDYL